MRYAARDDESGRGLQIVGAALAGAPAGCGRSQPANVAATVNNRVISYAELEDKVETAASAFLRAGCGKNHSVALFLGNSPDHPVNFFGALKAGARVVHLSPLDGEIALSHKLSDSGARVLVTLLQPDGQTDTFRGLRAIRDRVDLHERAERQPGGLDRGASRVKRADAMVRPPSLSASAELPRDVEGVATEHVELHGGKVRASSAGLGRGSTFGFQLPLSPCVHNCLRR